MKQLAILIISLFAFFTSSMAQKVMVETENDRVTAIRIGNDSMNWILKTDGTQYAWVTLRYAWGSMLGLPDGISVKVERRQEGDDVVETFILKNVSDHDIALTDVAISTPFNDNYPDAKTCMTSRCNAHIWAGGDAAWVKCMRMSGRGPHLGLVVTEGEIDDYEVWERGSKKGWSNFRGVLALRLPQMTIKKGKSYRISWRLFAHSGNNFAKGILLRDGIIVTSDKYVFEQGETAEVTFEFGSKAKSIKKRWTRLAKPLCRRRLVARQSRLGCSVSHRPTV